MVKDKLLGILIPRPKHMKGEKIIRQISRGAKNRVRGLGTAAAEIGHIR